MNKRPYEILGVAPSATHDEIKTAYRNLAKKLHPDLNPGNKTAESKFKEINAAYDLIGSPENRTKFDRGEFDEAYSHRDEAESEKSRNPFYRETQNDDARYSQSFGGIDGEIFDLFLETWAPVWATTARLIFLRIAPDRTSFIKWKSSFKDAVLGGESDITLPSGKRLRVKIPVAIDSGTKLRFAGLGGPGSGSAPAGDAYIEISVKPSRLFKRNGNDLEIELPISVSEAVLGAEVKVPTIDGSVLLKIPAGVSSGSRLRISGKGVPSSSAEKRGDLFTILKIIVPHDSDADFKRAVESWSQRQPFNARADWPGSQGGTM